MENRKIRKIVNNNGQANSKTTQEKSTKEIAVCGLLELKEGE
jgi:hypothetical protein